MPAGAACPQHHDFDRAVLGEPHAAIAPFHQAGAWCHFASLAVILAKVCSRVL